MICSLRMFTVRKRCHRIIENREKRKMRQNMHTIPNNQSTISVPTIPTTYTYLTFITRYIEIISFNKMKRRFVIKRIPYTPHSVLVLCSVLCVKEMIWLLWIPFSKWNTKTDSNVSISFLEQTRLLKCSSG